MRFVKVFGAVVLAIVFVVGAGLAPLFLLDWSIVKDEAEDLLSISLSRQVSISDLELDFGWNIHVHLSDLNLANADWAKDESLARISTLDFTIEIWPLIGGDIVIPEARISRARVSLERDEDGQVNWTPAQSLSETVAPDERTEFPTIGHLRIEDAQIVYGDAVRQLDTTMAIATAEATAEGRDSFKAELKGLLDEEELKIYFTGGALNVLQETKRPYPIDLDVVVGETEMLVRGEILEPLEFHGLKVDFELKGPSFAELFPLIAIPLPATPPYKLRGSLDRTGKVWSLEDFQGTVGDSDLSGSLTLDQSQVKPFLKAELVSEKLNFDDLGGVVGALPDPAESSSSEQKEEAREADKRSNIFPGTHLADERLHAMDMDVTFNGKQIIAEYLPIDSLSTRIQLSDGRALLRPLRVGISNGVVEGEAALNAREEIPSADAHIAFEDLELKLFFNQTEFINEMGGRISGEIDVLGVGHSLNDMMSTARGGAWIGIRDGSMSALVVEAAGLDLMEALGLVIEDDARIGLRCGRADLEVSKGVLTTKRAVIDTTDSVLVARGSIDLKSETFDVQIEAQAKDFSLIDASAPVAVSGKFKDPSVSIGGLDPLPFFELGDAENIDCDKLLAGRLERKPRQDEKTAD